jgi:hypothetical protein
MKMGISGLVALYFQNARVRFFCPRPLASSRCVVLDADSDDSASLASWASTTLSAAWRRTFSGISSQYSSRFTSDPLHRDRRIIFEGRSPRHVQPMRLCLGGSVKVVYPPCHVVRRRETKMTLAYKQQSCEKKTRERGRGSRTRTMSMPLLKST